MKPDNDKTKQLCLDLIRADTEAEVIRLLRTAGYWDDTKAWRYLGDEEFNYSSVGNQQSRAEQAIIEKLINSIDAKLIGEARRMGCLPLVGSSPQAQNTPTTIAEARTRFFGTRLADQEALSRSITVAATGAKPREDNGRPCFTIADDGEGQTPAKMPDTTCAANTPTAREVWSCKRDEGRSLGAGDQAQAPNRCELLALRVLVVSVAEKAGLDPVR